MMTWIAKTALKFLSYDALVELIAKALAYILEYARKNASQEAWEKAKDANKKVKAWTTLFEEVYEDDTLTPEEEQKIADAIAGCTATESIYNLVTGKKAAKKEAKKEVKVEPKKVEVPKVELKKVEPVSKTEPKKEVKAVEKRKPEAKKTPTKKVPGKKPAKVKKSAKKA